MSSNYPIIKKSTVPSAADITTNVGSFSNILSASDLDVQLALDTIDDMSFLDISDTFASYNAGRILFETTSAVTDSADFTYDSTNNILGVGAIQLDTTGTYTHSEGLLHWNDDDKTLNLDTEVSGTTIQVGQEIVVRATNKTGVTITNGSIVYISGAQGNRPTIALADADIEAQADTTIGVATADIANNGTGYVTEFGLVRDLDTSAFTEGDALYLSQTAGEIVNVPPVAPSHAVRVGYCIISNPSSGQILVSVDTGTDLSKAHDVNLTSPTDGQVLTYNAATTLWENQDASGGGSSASIVSTESGAITNLGTTPQTILCDCTSNSMTVNLPAATGNTDLVHFIKKIDATANVVTIDPNASETIDGALTRDITAQYDTYRVVCDGSNWYIT